MMRLLEVEEEEVVEEEVEVPAVAVVDDEDMFSSFCLNFEVGMIGSEIDGFLLAGFWRPFLFTGYIGGKANLFPLKIVKWSPVF